MSFANIWGPGGRPVSSLLPPVIRIRKIVCISTEKVYHISMTPKIDPTIPKPNPELRFLERILLEAWRAFRSEQDHGEKRGRAMILQAHLDEWLNQPEQVRELEPGRHPDADNAGIRGEVPPNAEMPFDRGGPAEGVFFFKTGNWSSQLFTQAELDADPNKSRDYGWYVVTLYEKVYASSIETYNHFSTEAALHRHIPSSAKSGGLEKDRYDVFLDPAGGPDPKRMFFAARYRTRDAALEEADRLAASFGIRFLAARIAGWVDNH